MAWGNSLPPTLKCCCSSASRPSVGRLGPWTADENLAGACVVNQRAELQVAGVTLDTGFLGVRGCDNRGPDLRLNFLPFAGELFELDLLRSSLRLSLPRSDIQLFPEFHFA